MLGCSGLVFRRAMSRRTAARMSDRKPTIAHTHDGQCHGVTPLAFLKFSDSR